MNKKIKTIEEFVDDSNEKILSHWTEFGFLGGINDNSDRLKMAQIFESIRKAILELESQFKSSRTVNVVFPIARYCFTKFGYVIKNTNKFCLFVDEYFSRPQMEIIQEALKHYRSGDGEKYNHEKAIQKYIDKVGGDPPTNYIGIDWEVEICLIIAEAVRDNNI